MGGASAAVDDQTQMPPGAGDRPSSCCHSCITRDIPWQVAHSANDPTNLEPPLEAPPSTGRLGDQLCFALYAATNAITRVYRPLLKTIGLTYPQYLVLLILWEQRSRQIGEIAERLHLPTHAVSPIVDRLEDAGLVRRVDDVHDGRVVHVELTEAGSGLEGAAAAVQSEVRCRTFLEDADVIQLRTKLLELVELMAID